MINNNIIIIDYGAGNVQSVKYALQRLGVEAVLSKDAAVISSADKVIFPGVGQAQSAMQQIRQAGLEKLIPALKQPVMGICLGMQLMCKYSEEGDTDCLDIFPLEVKRFKHELKIPHMGWNLLSDMDALIFNELAENPYMYFVHSYFIEKSDYTIATCNYKFSFSAALQKDNFYACQFHPEKSSSDGQQILKNFLEL